MPGAAAVMAFTCAKAAPPTRVIAAVRAFVPEGRSMAAGTQEAPSHKASPRNAPARRGEGQWALGYHEPLNKNEENKKNKDGLNVRQRIVDISARYGFDSIDPADLRGRFRWYGLYT